MECLRPLGECLSNAKSVGAALVEHLAGHPEVDKTGSEIVIVSLKFACETLQAISSELEHKRVAQAAILARPLYEQGIRVLWASLPASRWDCLHMDWLSGEINWAKDAEKATAELKDEASAVLKECGEEMKKIAAKGRVPNVELMLHDLVHDRPSPSDEKTKFYYQCYRELCQFSHGNFRWIGGRVRFDAIAQHVVLLSIWSVLMLGLAARHLMGSDVAGDYEKTALLIKQCQCKKFECFAES